MNNMKRIFASVTLIAALVLTPGCAHLFQKNQPVQNANTALGLGAAAWHQYVQVERSRCDEDTPCLERLTARDAKALESIQLAEQHVDDLALAISVGNKLKAGEHLDALEQIVMGLDPQHFRDTFDVLWSLRRQVAEMQ